MDTPFRDSPHHIPLWNEVSRKHAELGYHRSPPKCQEEFDTMFKHHSRNKQQQSDMRDFHFSFPSTSSNNPMMTSTTQDLCCFPCPNRQDSVEFVWASTSSDSSSGNDSDGIAKKKRKLMDYVERLMEQVLQKQEELQTKFLETIEKCEKEWIAREEAWKVQEMARIKKEKKVLAQERAMALAKDAAMLSFLQHLTRVTIPMPNIPTTMIDKPSEKLLNTLKKDPEVQQNGDDESCVRVDGQDNSAGESRIRMSCSRWPKAEIEALIMVKTDLDLKYHDSGPKGPLWEEISSSMKMLGYHRTAKRCKEKWENINKYYKRVRDSNKRRPEDSKTCPYFNLLDSLYAKKSI